jgi:hypothetical protein
MFSANDVTTVCYTDDNHFDIGDILYPYLKAVMITNPAYEDIYIPDYWLRVAHLDTAGAFNILDVLHESKEFLEQQLGSYCVPAPNYTYWNANDGSIISSSFGGFAAGNQIPGFIIAGKINIYRNWDEGDSDVINHEYAHYIMYACMEPIPDAGGSHHYHYPIVGSNHLGLSLSEGWAHFYAGLLDDDPVFINSTTTEPLWVLYQFEQPIPDVPYYDWADNLSLPPHPEAQYEGAHVKGSVVEALWDVYDYVNDQNYYIGGTLWGHNHDLNSSSYWCGVNEIWDVLTNFDPKPNDPNHDHCWNMYEFIHGWRTFGYPTDQTFKNLLNLTPSPFSSLEM